MKLGLLERIMKGKKSPKGATDVDKAVEAVCDLVVQVNAARDGLMQARQGLEREISDAMITGKTTDHTGMTAGVIEAQARLDGALRLLKTAQGEAAALIDAGRPGYRDAVSVVDAKIKSLQQQIGRRRAEAVAQFCHLHGLKVTWPSDFHRNGGLISLPVMGIGDEVYSEISAAAAEQPVPPDPQEAALADLRDQQLTMQTLAEQPSTMALDQLVTRAQRNRG